MRFVRPLLRRITHGITLGVRVIAIDAENRVLLVRHGYTPGWHFPGGGVDVGETTEAAARRELKEETNVEATGPLRLTGLYFNSRFGNRDHVACYRASTFTCGPVPAPGFEIAEIGFFPLSALPQGLSAGSARRLAELAGKAEPSAVW
ncbi:NUDIX domain-containing protein [Aquabacter cavernae]|uniref:NUDIX domain-containing protein n=1 Tax=Aquabacter cavernae TaxID=2496029 RepID=UPI000F8D75DB|nr:NUDIX domain-containing protein [Aquabacter cavernae]